MCSRRAVFLLLTTFQGCRHALDEFEQSFASRLDVGAVLNILGRPVALRRNVVPFVEQGVEGFEHECFVFFLSRLCQSASLLNGYRRLRFAAVSSSIIRGDFPQLLARRDQSHCPVCALDSPETSTSVGSV